MLRSTLSKKPVVVALLIIQLIPLVLFPASSFSPDTQEWWLPVVLAALVIIADLEIFIQRQDVAWPWYLVSFAQGFNIISRLMMMMPHATSNVNGTQVINAPYLVLTAVSMLISLFLLWYNELPDVRMALLRD
jgi:hypothetical protein